MLIMFFLLAFQITAEPVPMKAVSVADRQFEIPLGFSLEVVASPNLVERPIHAAFDDQGYLYVTNSSGTNDPVQKQLEDKPHGIYRLEDHDGDGFFDKSQLFADNLMFPEGILWYRGSLYVTAPPVIWKLTDQDGDGKVDERQAWFDGKTLTGCANDLHGPYLGLDGWIYWTKGAFAEQSYPRPGKPPLVTRAAHIFRAKPDGSGIEPVMTGGMDNPVDVVFMPEGERLFNGTFFQSPAGGKRDGIIHAIYGGIYGKLHDPIYDPVHPWTGPNVMPILVHLGPAAPSGFHRYESGNWGADYRDNLFNTCFNLRKVTRHRLTPLGATYEATTEDFVRSDDLDFHPTDVVEDADGSLLIINTGGWYKLCCPTSQLHKPDILGCIYRLRKTNTATGLDSKGSKIAWENLSLSGLVELFGDPRPSVSRRAIDLVAQQGPSALPALHSAWEAHPESLEQRQNLLWCAIRIEGNDARSFVRKGLDCPNSSLQQIAIHGISLWRDAAAIPSLVHALSDENLALRRVAAEAIGRIGSSETIPALIQALDHCGEDRILQHSLTYALIEIGDGDGIAKAMASQTQRISQQARQFAMIALDQLHHDVSMVQLLEDLDSPADALRDRAIWIAMRHPEWGPQLVDFWQRQLSSVSSPEEANALVYPLSKMVASPALQMLVGDSVRRENTPLLARKVALDVMRQASPDPYPAEWMEALTTALSNTDPNVLTQAISAAGTIRLRDEWMADPRLAEHVAKLDLQLLKISENPMHSAGTRAASAAAIQNLESPLSETLFAFLLSSVCDQESSTLRAAASRAVSRANLSPQQMRRLAEVMSQVGPFEILTLLQPFAGCEDSQVGQTLLSSLEKSTATAAIRGDLLRPAIEHFGPELVARGERFLASLDSEFDRKKKLIESALELLPQGDVRRGHRVFNNAKVACISCHEMGYVGGHIGPDLSNIGAVRSERDLLEAILFPSASFVRSYEPITVHTDDGKVLNGILKVDGSEEIELTISATEEARIRRDRIAELLPGTVSIMPAGLDQQLTLQELADLVVFLKSSR